MKKSIFIALALMLLPTSTLAFTDYGTDLSGRQCASPVLEDGSCNIVYSNDFSLIGSRSLNPSASSNVAQPNAPTYTERTARQKAVRAQICLILGC